MTGTDNAAALVAALAEPGELVEAVVRHARRRHVRLAGGEVTALSDNISVSVLVRSVRAGAVGCASTSRTDAAALDWAVRQARELRSLSAARLAPWDGAGWDPPASDRADWNSATADRAGRDRPGGEGTDRDPASRDRAAFDRGAFDRGGRGSGGWGRASVPDRWGELAALGAFPLAGAVQAVRDLERAALDAVAGAHPLGADWAQTCEVVDVANSAGLAVRYPHPEHALSLTLGLDGRTGRSAALAGRVRPVPHDADRADIVREVAAELRPGDTEPPAAALTCLLLAPRPAARLLSQVGAAFYGDRPDLGRGGLRTLGGRVLPDGFDLTDDAADPDGLVCAPCDDEGIPSRLTAVIRDGRLATLLHDRSSADPAAGEASTGNGWSVPRGAGVGYGIAVAAANLRLTGHADPPDDLLARAGTALYATRLDDGGGRGVDAPADRVRLTLSGWLVRGGEPAGRVSAATLNMPLSALLLRIAGLSTERQYYRIGARSTLRMGPAVAGTHLLIDDVPIMLRAAG